MTYIFTGDSWAMKAFTNENYNTGWYEESDFRLSDVWQVPYQGVYAPGHGNLEAMRRVQRLDSDRPIIWVWTEVGRDYGEVYDRPPYEWMQRDDFFRIRADLTDRVMATIRRNIKNPIALIGGLGDFDPVMAYAHGFHVLHPSWQRFMSEKLQSRYFQMGWGAGDIGWRQDYNDITPGRVATFAWDEQIKEWSWWEQEGYMCHEHPTPLSCREFGAHIKDRILTWLDPYEQG